MAVEVLADVGSCWRDGVDEPLAAGWDRWLRLMDAVAGAGAQAIKGQLLHRSMYPVGSKESRLVQDYELPLDWLPKLRAAASARGLEFLCTAYRAEHVPLVDPWVKRHKVSSFEANYQALLEAIGRSQKPVLISLGAQAAEQWLGCGRWLTAGQWASGVVGPYTGTVTYLHCVSAYPAQPEQMNLSSLLAWNVETPHDEGPRYRSAAFGLLPMGLSDHTSPLSAVAAVMAVALGATTIETHVCEAHTDRNPDAGFARTPEEFRRYVAAVQEAAVMLGDGVKRAMPGELTAYRYDPATGTRGVPADA